MFLTFDKFLNTCFIDIIIGDAVTLLLLKNLVLEKLLLLLCAHIFILLNYHLRILFCFLCHSAFWSFVKVDCYLLMGLGLCRGDYLSWDVNWSTRGIESWESYFEGEDLSFFVNCFNILFYFGVFWEGRDYWDANLI